MKYLLSSALVALILGIPYNALADEVTLVGPGGVRCAIDKIAPEFQKKTGHVIKPTIGSGGATHQQVVKGDPFDVPIVQPPLEDVLKSGHVVNSTETPLATVPIVVIIKKGSPKPDISTAAAVKKLLLGAKYTSYPDGRGGLGGAAGVSIDASFTKMGIFEQMKPKVKRVQGTSLQKLVTSGEIDFGLTFASEVTDPGVEVVGVLPKDISTPTGLVGFVGAHTKVPAAAKALLSYLSSAEANAIYKSCGMTPGK